MSYCRWSSDAYQCDVYVYEHVAGGFVCHIAGRKRIFKGPIPPEPQDAEGWVDWHMKISAMCEESEMVDIGLPLDGETFHTHTALQMANILTDLKMIGYRVPNYAIDALMKDGASNGYG